MVSHVTLDKGTRLLRACEQTTTAPITLDVEMPSIAPDSLAFIQHSAGCHRPSERSRPHAQRRIATVRISWEERLKVDATE